MLFDPRKSKTVPDKQLREISLGIFFFVVVVDWFLFLTDLNRIR